MVHPYRKLSVRERRFYSTLRETYILPETLMQCNGMGDGLHHRKQQPAAPLRNALSSPLREDPYLLLLRQLATDFEQALQQEHPESWWQHFINKHSYTLLRSYFACLSKLNIGIGHTKHPDFVLITFEKTLEILEIKKPSQPLLQHDKSRNNYYWSSGLSKAIIQVKNYQEDARRHAAGLRRYLQTTYALDIGTNTFKGIILAGLSTTFTNPKEREDFRILSTADKHIRFITYDQLANDLRQYIRILERSGHS